MESVSGCTALHVIAVSVVDICTLINSEMKRGKSSKSLKLHYCTVPFFFCRLGLAGFPQEMLPAHPSCGAADASGAGRGIKVSTGITETASPIQNPCQKPGPEVFLSVNVH